MQFPLNRLKECQILKRLAFFFDAPILTQKAITTGFVKRKSKLCALSFLQLCLIHTHTACTKSLSEACTFLRETIGVKLRKQSLDDRFNISAVLFIRKLVEELMKSQICTALADSTTTVPCKTNFFKRILIGDSTAFSLPTQFTTSYKGSGGMCSTSAIKLYYEYDLLSGSLNCLTDANGVRSDQTFNEIENIHTGDLVIKDLGFYQMPFFRKLQQKGAYFITRLPARSKLFIFDKQISLESLLTSIPAFSSSTECKVKVGVDLKERTALGEK